MRAVVVVESMFGNTELMAREVAEGLVERGVEVDVVDVRRCRAEDLVGRDLLVVGAPTHAFSLSRASTRADAVRQGAEPARATRGVRDWLDGLDAAYPSSASRPRAAVFDTRVQRVRRLPGSAARRAARTLRARGFDVVSRASFFVQDVAGPVVDGEQARARSWAAGLVEPAA